MFTNWEFWLAAITAVVAIVAVLLNYSQIQLSNRQSLFDRRLDCYLKIDGLVQLYAEAKTMLKPLFEDEIIYSLQVEFVMLTNNIFLEDVGPVISNPKDDLLHKKFLSKCAELKNLSKQIPLIFIGDSAKNASDFISAYERLLFTMGKYQTLLDCIKDSMKTSVQKITYEEACRISHEPAHRDELLGACNDIEKAYVSMAQNSTLENLKKEIRLWHLDWRR